MFCCFLSVKVILSTKATNAKARVAAFNLLEEIGNIFIYFDSCSKEGRYFILPLF